MSESPSLDVHKAKALELAVQAGGEPAKVVERANAYHEFLSGNRTGKPAGAAAAQAPAASAKPTAAATGKPAAAPKATPAPGTKPAAAPKPTAAAPKPTAAGVAPKGDTKDPKGNNTFDDVTGALQKVMRSVTGDNTKRDKGRALAYSILAAKGGGVKKVADLQPALYDAVVAGCEEAAKGAAAKPAAAADASKAAATVVEDDLGGPVDTSGASADTAGADDPPEGGSGDEDA